MEKINIAKLLKDCPKGTKLYSLVHGEVELTRVGVECIYCKPNYLNYELGFNLDGRWIENTGECILFPSKENRDWTKFQRPFKDGDVITSTNSICSFVAIFKKKQTDTTFVRYVSLTLDDEPQFWAKEDWADFNKPRLATEEEKQKLFDAIKENGYKWNPETKTLEKLIEPKFKVEDRIKSKNRYTNYLNDNHIFTITEIRDGRYWSNRLAIEYISEQDDWELVPSKFDITTLKPFESRVLVRFGNDDIWRPAIYGFTNSGRYYIVGGVFWEQCIPYENNRHLLGTKDDCDEYFKTWK